MQKGRIISTTEILLADIADSLRILAKRPRLDIRPSGEVIVPDDEAEKKPKEESKRVSAPKGEPAKTEGAGVPAAEAGAPAKTGAKKSGRKKK